MNEAIKDEVIKAVQKWRPRLRLMDWSVAYEFNADVPNPSVVMQAQYRRAKLRLPKSFGNSNNDGNTAVGAYLTAEKVILHELCHLLVAHIQVAAKARIPAENTTLHVFGKRRSNEPTSALLYDNVVEETTEWLARIIWEAYECTAWDAEPSA